MTAAKQHHDDEELKPLYYAENGMVWKRPVKTGETENGSSYALGFPVCTMHEAVGDKAAEAVAAIMNRGEAMPDLIEAAQNIENDAGHIPANLWQMLQAAIAKAGGRAK